LKKQLVYFFLSSFFILFFAAGCAVKTAAPPIYKGMELSKDEIIRIQKEQVQSLKVKVDIEMEKGKADYSVRGLLLVKQPRQLHLKLYNFGMLVFDMAMNEQNVAISTGGASQIYQNLSLQLFYSIMWWEALDNAQMEKRRGDYIFTTADRELQLDGDTLIPVKQRIAIMNNLLYITYEEPVLTDNYGYPSKIVVDTGVEKFTITIKTLMLNPPLEEKDFIIPS